MNIQVLILTLGFRVFGFGLIFRAIWQADLLSPKLLPEMYSLNIQDFWILNTFYIQGLSSLILGVFCIRYGPNIARAANRRWPISCIIRHEATVALQQGFWSMFGIVLALKYLPYYIHLSVNELGQDALDDKYYVRVIVGQQSPTIKVLIFGFFAAYFIFKAGSTQQLVTISGEDE